MKKLIALVLTVLLSASAAWAQEKNWTAERMNYLKSPQFDPLIQANPERKAMGQAFQAKDFRKTVELGSKWLQKAPVDISAHYILAIAYSQLGDTEQFELYQKNVRGIVDSIGTSGNGSPEHPFMVIATEEVHDFLSITGASRCKFQLKGEIDRAVCLDHNKKEIAVFFKYFPEYWASLPGNETAAKYAAEMKAKAGQAQS